MIKLSRIALALFFVSFSVSFSTGAHAATILSFDSTPQSWVGQGESFTVTPDDDYTFTHSGNFNSGLSFRVASFNSPFGSAFNPGSGDRYNYWTLDLAAPFFARLEQGLYENAARFPFQNSDQPGLDFSGNHRGNNRNAGYFDILEISFSALGDLESLAVNFTQFGEERPEWRIDGRLRYNSSISIAVSESTSMGLLGLGLLGLGMTRVRKPR